MRDFVATTFTWLPSVDSDFVPMSGVDMTSLPLGLPASGVDKTSLPLGLPASGVDTTSLPLRALVSGEDPTSLPLGVGLPTDSCSWGGHSFPFLMATQINKNDNHSY
jgi:hypothetical protein